MEIEEMSTITIVSEFKELILVLTNSWIAVH